MGELVASIRYHFSGEFVAANREEVTGEPMQLEDVAFRLPRVGLLSTVRVLFSTLFSLLIGTEIRGVQLCPQADLPERST